MVRFVKYANSFQANEAIEKCLVGVLAAVLRLQYRAAADHVFNIGMVYADTLTSGLFVGGRLPSGMIQPIHVPSVIEHLVRESDHSFVLNSSSYKKFAAAIDGVIVSGVRQRVAEVVVVPEHADADLHLNFAGYVRLASASTIAGLGDDSQIVHRMPRWVFRVVEWFRKMFQSKVDDSAIRRLAGIAACAVPGFIVAQGYDLSSLDRRTSGILRKMLEQALAAQDMKDVALAVGQLDLITGQTIPPRLLA
jgi:hypothetical protein